MLPFLSPIRKYLILISTLEGGATQGRRRRNDDKSPQASSLSSKKKRESAVRKLKGPWQASQDLRPLVPSLDRRLFIYLFIYFFFICRSPSQVYFADRSDNCKFGLCGGGGSFCFFVFLFFFSNKKRDSNVVQLTLLV